MSDFQRPKDGFPYQWAGVKVNSQPDNLPPNKYPYAQNVRSTGGGSLICRPGQSIRFATTSSPVTDISSYATLQTDNLPRYLARNTLNSIYLDNGVSVGSLAVGGLGVSMIPFRPNQSPQTWMYIASLNDYQKFSAPVSNVVTQRKVGIAEPQTSPDACTDTRNVFKLVNSDSAVSWTNASVAGAASSVARGSADTAIAFFADPAGVAPIVSPRYSVQVGANQYQLGEFINIAISGGGSAGLTVDDIFPAISPQGTATIQSIVYYSGSTGRCVIQPSQLPEDTLANQGATALQSIGPTAAPQALASLRRGSLITLNSGGANAETVFVLSVTIGPTGTTAIECSTASTHVASETITGQNAISISTGINVTTLTGQAISSIAIQSAISGAGTGTLTLGISSANNPFTHQGIPVLSYLPTPQQDDYVHISLNISNLSDITNIQVQFDVGDGSFTQNYFYFDIQPDALQQFVAGTVTQLAASQLAAQQAGIRNDLNNIPIRQLVNPTSDGSGDTPRIDQTVDVPGSSAIDNINPSTITALGASQWSEVLFSIASMTRVGGDLTKTLANVNSIRVSITATNAFTFQLSSIWVGAGGQPDVGDVGALYRYIVRPRDSRTGAIGNGSPSSRYGVNPRRQWVIISPPSAAFDPQIDTWDIFRWGGTVLSWRYIGSMPSSAASFVDNNFDDAAQAGNLLETDNFEPWPSVDYQFNGTASTVCGTLALVTIPGSSGCSPTQWLPGTLVEVGGFQSVTLRLRPVLISGTTFRLEFIECSNFATNVSILVQEPLLANQHQQFLFGPDDQGRVFGVGDPLRAGTLSYCKPNNPDSVPDTYNRDICPPSEPLLGGIIVDGRAWVSSPERWWELLPQQSDNDSELYNPVQSPLPRGIVSGFALCTDGVQKYWWAKDGIYSDAGSLTDADLYSVFPFEGRTSQTPSYNGFAISPPDYSRSGTFRLAHSNGFLYATYQDSGGIYRVLTCDLKHGNSWIPDVYSPAVTAFYHPTQQSGSLATSGSAYDETLMANVNGQVSTQKKHTNDLGGAISCNVFSFEWDAGDERAPKQWGDAFMDVTPNAPAGVSVSFMSQGAPLAGTTQVIPTSTSRQRVPLTTEGIVVSDFMGFGATWTEDFTIQTASTVLNMWQPSYVVQPARGISYKTFGTSYDTSGFGHIPWMEIAYVSTAIITLTITCQDGTSPSVISIPSSSGAYLRILIRPTFNKGRLYAFQYSSSAPFQIFEDDSIIMWAPWGRSSGYQGQKSLGMPGVASSPV